MYLKVKKMIFFLSKILEKQKKKTDMWLIIGKSLSPGPSKLKLTVFLFSGFCGWHLLTAAQERRKIFL